VGEQGKKGKDGTGKSQTTIEIERGGTQKRRKTEYLMSPVKRGRKEKEGERKREKKRRKGEVPLKRFSRWAP